ncbi:MAG: DUF2341 domain-containing protein [Gemmataceae bacterium]
MPWLSVVFVLASASPAVSQYQDWKHSGALFILTTPEGAPMPAAASVENFPLLVRLHQDFFDFSQANPNGSDVRFSSATGEPLAYQIEEWNAPKGAASIWVRVPKIAGNSRQQIKLHWGNPGAKSESNGKAVFNESNGYLTVSHMGPAAKDEVGIVELQDTGTTSVPGVVGAARHFPGQKGIFCGDKIGGYPTDASSHTTEAWFRAEKPNSYVVAWGNEQAQGKVVMCYRSPPHVIMDCYFSGGNVAGKSTLSKSEWVHVAHTYEKGASCLYVNGVLDGINTSKSAPLHLKSPSRLWIGGWYHNYSFVGDIDEVRISKVVRSPDWIRLQYENQKPLQTLVGPVVQPGNEFELAQAPPTLQEGKSVTLTAKAGGAQRLYWTVTRGGKEAVVATDRLAYTLDAGRTVGETSAIVRVKAVYPNEVKERQTSFKITDDIPEPEFALQAPAEWDGRKTIEVVPQITNLESIRSKGADKLNIVWNVSDLATINETQPGKLILKRAQHSGKLTVTAAIDNGGAPAVKAITIAVKEPAKDAWVEYVPSKHEKPEDGQFYARDDKNEGALHYSGVLTEAADAVFLKVFAGDKPFSSEVQKRRPTARMPLR